MRSKCGITNYKRKFNRWEIKYALHRSRIPGLIKTLKGYMIPDAYGDPDRGYANFSVYCDSPDLQFFWEKIEGLKFRRKLRFRRYENQEDAFVEIKQRIGKTVQKRRVCWPLERIEKVFLRGALNEEYLGDNLDRIESEILLLWRTYNLRPKLATWYRRLALVGNMDPGLRITFDTSVSYSTEALDIGAPFVNGKEIVDPRIAIMEIKFNDRAPRWLSGIIAESRLQSRRISKYCRGVDLKLFGGRNT